MAKIISTGFIKDTVNGIKINNTYKSHSSNYKAKISRKVIYIVMHYTGNEQDSAKANANYFKGANRGASAHFFVDDKNIYNTVALKNVAYHCGATSYKHSSCRNDNSFGIEMCTSGDYKVSAKTKTNAAYLVANLCKRAGIKASELDKYLLRHYDITGKNCPAQMAGANNAEWIAFKKQVKKIMEPTAASFKVKITANSLNVRIGAGVSYAIATTVKKGEVYTISDTKTISGSKWGKLKSGKGWINLYYTKKV